METGAPFCLTWRDSALYALAVGAARGPRYAWTQDERFVNERHPRFTTLPTLACTFALRGGTQSLTEALAGAGLRFDPSTLLHTEQVVRLHAPGLLPSAENREVVSLLNSTRLVSVAERAGGTLARVQTECRRSSDGVQTALETTQRTDTSLRRARGHVHRWRPSTKQGAPHQRQSSKGGAAAAAFPCGLVSSGCVGGTHRCECGAPLPTLRR